MPVVLMVDGPSLGGFVCPATIVTTELWKMGQVRPGDAVRFRQLTVEEAYVKRFTVDRMVELVNQTARGVLPSAEAAEKSLESFAVDVPACPPTEAVLRVIPAVEGGHPGAQVRLAGDRYVFLEYGPMELDINLRVRVHEIEQYLAAQSIDGLIETSPGVRSVMIEYDQRRLPVSKLLQILEEAEQRMQPADGIQLPYRVIHLPLAFNERWTHEAINRYMRSVRPQAPYLPSNVEFIAKNNGLEGDPIEAVRKVLFEASYMVMGLGDVYLGAPCAVPVDPRHRLVVPKYNPARTYTPEGGVGIGGAYMCIYPMASPGGYQLVGRTLPIWNAFTRTGPFTPGKPWLLRNFDQVRFYEVPEDDLEALRNDFRNGRLDIKVEHATFNVHEYNEFMKGVAGEYEALRRRQRAAMAQQMALDAEMLRQLDAAKLEEAPSAVVRIEVGENDDNPYEGMEGTPVTAAVTGTTWEVKVKKGDAVKAGDTLIVLEAMKMEYAVVAPCDGTVQHIRVQQGDMVSQGTPLCLLAA